jgi:hypothetical protein
MARINPQAMALGFVAPQGQDFQLGMAIAL